VIGTISLTTRIVFITCSLLNVGDYSSFVSKIKRESLLKDTYYWPLTQFLYIFVVETLPLLAFLLSLVLSNINNKKYYQSQLAQL
jgi:hypothetical protein